MSRFSKTSQGVFKKKNYEANLDNFFNDMSLVKHRIVKVQKPPY